MPKVRWYSFSKVFASQKYNVFTSVVNVNSKLKVAKQSPHKTVFGMTCSLISKFLYKIC